MWIGAGEADSHQAATAERIQMTMQKKRERRENREELERMKEALVKEGYAVFSPSDSRLSICTAYKIAASAKPSDTDDLEYDVFVDWLTDNVVLKAYSRFKKAGCAVAVIRDDICMKTQTQLVVHVDKLWSDLKAAFADNSQLIVLQREQKAMDEMWSKVRTIEEGRALIDKHRKSIGVAADLSDRA